MTHWALIILMSACNGSMEKVEGFSSKESCIHAAEEMSVISPWLKTVCVEVK